MISLLRSFVCVRPVGQALIVLSVVAIWLGCQVNALWALDLQAVNGAELSQRRTQGAKGLDPVVVKAQVLLDRARFSPGEIDGRMGENLIKAIKAFAAARGLNGDRQLTPELWSTLTTTSSDPVLVEYTVSDDDVKGPFLDRVPAKMEEMRGVHRLSYGSAVEALAEKFHMSEALLKALNPKSSFEAGQTIVVANVTDEVSNIKISRIEVDKSERVLRAFDKAGELVTVLPATVGSTEKPAPSGTFRVTNVTRNPTYRYNPAYAFKGVKATEPFVINPGPNNPVGVVWIALSAKSYGIHGTPNPSQVSKTESNGCIRLTNWDAKQLAAMVSKGTTVDFIGTEASRPAAKRATKSRQATKR
jgi:lipoprotein-anchoring transpeptidase ErfK/SrfK